MPPDHPLETPARVRRYWSTLLSDVRETLAEYEDEGYDGLVLRSGPVTVLGAGEDGPDPTLSIVLPDSEFETIETIVDGATISSADVYAGTTDDLVLLGVYLKVEPEAVVVGFPAYYDRGSDMRRIEEAQTHGTLAVRFRTLGGEQLLVRCTDPEQFVPDPG